MISKRSINKIARRFGVEVHGKGYLQSLAKGEFKQNCFEVQRQLIHKKNPLIFDVGANRGNVVDQYLSYFPAAIIHAFEPFPESYNILKQRHGNNPKVICFPKAISSANGVKEFFVNKNVDTNSLLKPKLTGLSSDKQVSHVITIEVETIILDEYCVRENIDHIDILKMDIQGGEYEALKGMTKMLTQNKIDLIYSEVYFVQQYEEQPLFHDISKLLFQYGYQLQDIYNPIYGNGCIAWADVIFTKIINHN